MTKNSEPCPQCDGDGYVHHDDPTSGPSQCPGCLGDKTKEAYDTYQLEREEDFDRRYKL